MYVVVNARCKRHGELRASVDRPPEAAYCPVCGEYLELRIIGSWHSPAPWTLRPLIDTTGAMVCVNCGRLLPADHFESMHRRGSTKTCKGCRASWSRSHAKRKLA